jgi:hypothetical protein
MATENSDTAGLWERANPLLRTDFPTWIAVVIETDGKRRVGKSGRRTEEREAIHCPSLALRDVRGEHRVGK